MTNSRKWRPITDWLAWKTCTADISSWFQSRVHVYTCTRDWYQLLKSAVHVFQANQSVIGLHFLHFVIPTTKIISWEAASIFQFCHPKSQNTTFGSDPDFRILLFISRTKIRLLEAPSIFWFASFLHLKIFKSIDKWPRMNKVSGSLQNDVKREYSPFLILDSPHRSSRVQSWKQSRHDQRQSRQAQSRADRLRA